MVLEPVVTNMKQAIWHWAHLQSHLHLNRIHFGQVPRFMHVIPQCGCSQ